MDKQQLASKIWASANKMRSKIEANEYKDYILGFIFYKFLSDKEIEFLKANDSTEEDIENLTEDDRESVEFIQKGIGYFIAYNDLFSTWIEQGKDFDVSNVRDALSAFDRLIDKNQKSLFDHIFDTLQTGLSKLGSSAGAQTKAIKELLQLIKDIPMDGKQDYDVLGFIYEYLISMFAANAGKKAGEFYTPHEVSVLMSEIVADYLKNKEEIKIYDPTSGSGSLLINIGKAVAQHSNVKDNIKYYAQELKENTYNLTRMNLVMRGILPANIATRNGDTLEEDWPYFDENQEYEPLYVNAVVSNPPYSQNWDPSDKDSDPRYAEYGLASKTRADYAFLLHDLYHLVPDGIMTIVLPHGVLFRGGEEGTIRKNLIEKNKIAAIIGLPGDIFFGTSIPTIIMVLRQKRDNDDVLIIDASKGFTKEGKNNKLRSSDIKKIVDVVTNREDVDKFSRVVSKDEIRTNDYNLNIPRYVDSSDTEESWDIYSLMFGGIPKSEVDSLKNYWQAFPDLRHALFEEDDASYAKVKADSIEDLIMQHADVMNFKDAYLSSFAGFDDYLKKQLIDEMASLNAVKTESAISNEMFNRLKSIPLVDKYEAYQALDDEWHQISTDIEILQAEGFEAVRKIESKKGDSKEKDVQDGHVIPFDLIQAQDPILKKEKAEILEKEEQLTKISSNYDEIIASLTKEEQDTPILNDTSDKFVTAELNKKVKEILDDVESDEINSLKEYMELSKKSEKDAYVIAHPEVGWGAMEVGKSGYAKKDILKYLVHLQSQHEFQVDSFEAKILDVSRMMTEEKELKIVLNGKNKTKSQAKVIGLKERLCLHTEEAIENLTDDQAKKLLELKWIDPIKEALDKLPGLVINSLTNKITELSDKYATTYSDIVDSEKTAEASLFSMLDELQGSESDMEGLRQFKKLLGGE